MRLARRWRSWLPATDASQDGSALAGRSLIAWGLWLAPLVALGLAFGAERLMSASDSRLAIVPGTDHILRSLNPAIHHLDQAIIGYLLMALAATAFALTLRKDVFRPPSAVAQSTGPTPALRLERPSMRAAGALIVAAVAWIVLLARLLDKGADWYNPLLLVISVALPAVVLLRLDLQRGVSFRVKVEVWEIAALAALTAAGGLILTFDLAHTPDNMWGDEGLFWVAARALAQHRQDIDVFAPGVYSFPLASSIFQAASLKLFGYDLWSWRFSSVVAVLATIVPMYFLVRAMFDRTTAFASVALMIGSPFLLAFGRMGYNNIQALFPLVTALLLIYAAVGRRSALLFFAAGATAGLGFYTYYAARIAVPIIGGYVLHAWLTRRMTPREAAYGLALAALGTAMVGLLPTIRLLTAGDEALQSKLVEGVITNSIYVKAVYPKMSVDALSSVSVSGVHLVTDPGTVFRLLARGVLRTLFAFHRTDLVEEHFISGSLGGPVVSALLLPGLAVAIRRVKEPGPALLLLWAAAALVLMSILSAYPPTHTHLVAIIPALAIAYGLAITVTARSLTRLMKPGWAFAATGFVAIAVIFFAQIGVRQYFDNTKRDFPPDLDIALWFQAEDVGAGHEVVLVFSDLKYRQYVPWGVREFNLQDRFRTLNITGLQYPEIAAGLHQADVVVVDGSEVDTVLAPLRAELPDWQISSRNAADGGPLYLMLRPPE